jgi:hypothetical protein
MKKILFLLFGASILYACNPASTKEVTATNTDLIQQNLNGKVEKYTEESYTVDSVGNQKKDSAVYESELDQKGYLTKVISKDTSGKVIEETTFARFENGTPKEIVTKANGKQTKKFILELDSNKKFSVAKVYDSSDKMSSYYKEITQDEYENVLGATEYTPENKLKSSFTQSYSKGHFMGTIGKDSLGKETYRSTYKLDDKGNPVEESETTIAKDSTKTTLTTFKYDSYDDKGNWTQRTQYNDKNKPTKISKRSFTYYKD